MDKEIEVRKVKKGRIVALVLLYILAVLFVLAMVANLFLRNTQLITGDAVILIIIIWGINKVQNGKK